MYIRKASIMSQHGTWSCIFHKRYTPQHSGLLYIPRNRWSDGSFSIQACKSIQITIDVNCEPDSKNSRSA
uniref:Uncharacterized protein n=1 Tax=Arundo donax TaxID=35708 RepID=A0A0A9HKP0_ARUDO